MSNGDPNSTGPGAAGQPSPAGNQPSAGDRPIGDGSPATHPPLGKEASAGGAKPGAAIPVPRVSLHARTAATGGTLTVERDPSRFQQRTKARARFGTVFAIACFLATLVGVLVLAALLVDIVRDGWSHLSPRFLTSFPSRMPARAGVKPALLGSVWILVMTAIIAFPLGVGTAIWLEEYAPDNRLTRVIETNIANLAGVPSVVYGILGLALFVRAFSFGRSVLAAAFTLALLILPVIIIASQEAIKAVPGSIRLGAYALGATRWEAIRLQVLPLAMPGILTGTILALSRAIGEAAPVILVGALGFLAFVPKSPFDGFTVVPFQIYNWISRPQAEFQQLAAAASIVLLALLLTMNASAIWLRNHYSRRF